MCITLRKPYQPTTYSPTPLLPYSPHYSLQDDDQVAEAQQREQLGKELDKNDKGAPDYQTGEKRNKKWSIICLGVECLIREKHLRAEDIMLWVDWLSIYQDDEDVSESVSAYVRK